MKEGIEYKYKNETGEQYILESTYLFQGHNQLSLLPLGTVMEHILLFSIHCPKHLGQLCKTYYYSLHTVPNIRDSYVTYIIILCTLSQTLGTVI